MNESEMNMAGCASFISMYQQIHFNTNKQQIGGGGGGVSELFWKNNVIVTL